jgi:hypothetical protein
MIRATATIGETDFVILGLTAGDIDRLTKDNPIHMDGASIGRPNQDILIVYGDSPAEVIQNLKKMGLDVPDPENIHIEGPDGERREDAAS